MRVPNPEHETHAWRIREIAPDFTLEDVWALPVHGDAGEFHTLLQVMTSSLDIANSDSLPTRLLWRARDLLGKWFNIGRISAPAGGGDPDVLPIPGSDESSLSHRLPEDLRNTAVDMHFSSVPFTPLYRTDTEFAAELSNRTVHAVMHLVWIDRGEGRYQGQLGVYVKPRGRIGKAYMASIAPFRHWIVYPALMKQIEKEWSKRLPD